jgi:hypothetical protein
MAYKVLEKYDEMLAKWILEIMPMPGNNGWEQELDKQIERVLTCWRTYQRTGSGRGKLNSHNLYQDCAVLWYINW